MFDAAGALFALALAAFLAGEALALLDPSLGPTASERVRRWAGAHGWRRLLLGAALALVYLHIVYEWPW